MKIIIGCQEVCGWIEILSEEFKRTGNDVISISNKNNFFKKTQYTLNKESFEKDYIKLRFKSEFLTYLVYNIYKFCRILAKVFLKKELNNKIKVHANNYLYKTTDLYIHIWEGLEANDVDLIKFKKNKAKIVSYFVGDDIRHYESALKEFNINNNYFIEYSKKELLQQMKKLRMHEKYSDAIFSVPDQSSLALRPYFHIQIPIDLSKYTFKKTENTIPVIFHIPSAPLLKGTLIFEKVMSELKDEGLNFEFISLTNISNEQVKELLTNADILLDELYFHGPGMLGIEAMASGCCVVVKYLEKSPNCFKPPVISVTEFNLKEKLRELIINKELREKLIDKGLEFVTKTNSVNNVAKLILNKINFTDYDYLPTYFRNDFIPLHNLVDEINEKTNFLKDELWYKANVKSGERLGLKF